VETKVYVVRDTGGQILDVKLTLDAAQAIARDYAPASVERFIADKRPVRYQPRHTAKEADHGSQSNQHRVHEGRRA
jgi:hypothetical protein